MLESNGETAPRSVQAGSTGRLQGTFKIKELEHVRSEKVEQLFRGWL
jgi:hypothetical protein